MSCLVFGLSGFWIFRHDVIFFSLQAVFLLFLLAVYGLGLVLILMLSGLDSVLASGVSVGTALTSIQTLEEEKVSSGV